jgi:hypothetical protein
MSCTLIPLGFHCNITFLQQDLGIKRETGLFEWLESRKLQHITDIVNIIAREINTHIIHNNNKYIYVLHKDVLTYHYKAEEYKEIFTRRARRFLELIRNSESLIFARINPIDETTSADEIRNFCNAIHSINPALRIKFLIIHTVVAAENFKGFDTSQIQNAEVTQKYFLHADCPDVYLRNNATIQAQFTRFLDELCYPTTEKNTTTFSDKD